MTRLTPGVVAPEFSARAARGSRITAQGLHGNPVLLQFHRFASCPACFISVRKFTSRVGELRDEGLKVVAFFYFRPLRSLPSHSRTSRQTSSWSAIRIGRYFDAYGVERSHRKFFRPHPLAVGVSGWFKGAKFQPVANLTREDTAGVPADFIIDGDGQPRFAHYGRHAADSLGIDDALAAYRTIW